MLKSLVNTMKTLCIAAIVSTALVGCTVIHNSSDVSIQQSGTVLGG